MAVGSKLVDPSHNTSTLTIRRVSGVAMINKGSAVCNDREHNDAYFEELDRGMLQWVSAALVLVSRGDRSLPALGK